MYQNETLSSTIRAEKHQISDSYFALVDCIDNVVYFINRDFGFNFTGWYKRGIVDNNSIISGTNTNISNQKNKTSTYN